MVENINDIDHAGFLTNANCRALQDYVPCETFGQFVTAKDHTMTVVAMLTDVFFATALERRTGKVVDFKVKDMLLYVQDQDVRTFISQLLFDPVFKRFVRLEHSGFKIKPKKLLKLLDFICEDAAEIGLYVTYWYCQEGKENYISTEARRNSAMPSPLGDLFQPGILERLRHIANVEAADYRKAGEFLSRANPMIDLDVNSGHRMITMTIPSGHPLAEELSEEEIELRTMIGSLVDGLLIVPAGSMSHDDGMAGMMFRDVMHARYGMTTLPMAENGLSMNDQARLLAVSKSDPSAKIALDVLSRLVAMHKAGKLKPYSVPGMTFFTDRQIWPQPNDSEEAPTDIPSFRLPGGDTKH